MKRLVIVAALVYAVLYAGYLYSTRKSGPPVDTIVATSLKSLQAQNRLTVFSARFVTAVTSTKSRFGLNASKTMILPGVVRYDVDLAALKPADVGWDAASKTLSVKLPPVTIAGPDFDLEQTRE